MGETLKVLHVIADLDPRSGGTSRAVADLTGALAKEPGLEVAVMFQAKPGQKHLPTDPAVQRISAPADSHWARISGWPFRNVLVSEIKRTRPDVIHLHGLWQPLCHWTASLAAQNGIPFVVQPHGMLEPWALAHKAWRKRLSMMFYQRRDLRMASALVASTEREVESFRKLGLANDVAVIPHGIHIGDEKNSVDETAPKPEAPRTVLFLSRLHPVKGLPVLLRAWSQIDRTGWQLVVAGPDEGGHQRQMQNFVAELELQNCVRFVGEIQGHAKVLAYRSADLFVLPTQSENFGIVIVEALSHGVPVITTHAAPWPVLEETHSGWWIEQGLGPLVGALKAAMALSDEDRRAMGERGRILARAYDWQRVAASLSAHYRRTRDN